MVCAIRYIPTLAIVKTIRSRRVGNYHRVLQAIDYILRHQITPRTETRATATHTMRLNGDVVHDFALYHSQAGGT